jgi:hypothetical protein
MTDDGFTARELWGIAWVLGLIAVAAWIRVAFLLDNGTAQWTPQLGLTLGAASLASAFSPACTVLSGVKSAAGRLGDPTATD